MENRISRNRSLGLGAGIWGFVLFFAVVTGFSESFAEPLSITVYNKYEQNFINTSDCFTNRSAGAYYFNVNNDMVFIEKEIETVNFANETIKFKVIGLFDDNVEDSAFNPYEARNTRWENPEKKNWREPWVKAESKRWEAFRH